MKTRTGSWPGTETAGASATSVVAPMGRASEGLCVAQVNSEIGYSGGEVQMFLMIDGLTERGHRSIVFCQPGSRSEEEAARRRIPCVGVRMRNSADVLAVLGLTRAFRRLGVDLVHLHTGRANWLGGLAARFCSLPALSTRRMDRAVRRGAGTRFLYEHLLSVAVAISPGVVTRLEEGGVPAERVRLIYEAVDPERIRQSAGRERTRSGLGAGPADSVLLTLAALIARKGLDVLLDAVARLRADGLRPAVWIAGEGPERSALEEMAHNLGLGGQVRFLGRREDTADLLAAADVFVLPSRREGLGVAALEAMAAARPIVCSAVGGLADSVVDGRTGVHVAPGDAEALRLALGRLLTDGALRRRLGAAGPERIAEGFLADQMVDGYQSLYREMVEQWRRRGT